MMNTMTKTINLTALAAALASASLFPQYAVAEQTSTTGAGALATAARVDISVVIPRFLELRVGSVGATIDLVTFTVPAANVGDSSVIAGTGGDLGAGQVTVTVRANSGQVTITPTNNSGGTGLANGVAGQFISYSDIATASSAAGTLPAPTLSNAGGTAVTPTLSAGNVTNRAANWTYTYLNTTVPNSGTYGTSVNGGRVTYTASTP